MNDEELAKLQEQIDITVDELKNKIKELNSLRDQSHIKDKLIHFAREREQHVDVMKTVYPGLKRPMNEYEIAITGLLYLFFDENYADIDLKNVKINRMETLAKITPKIRTYDYVLERIEEPRIELIEQQMKVCDELLKTSKFYHPHMKAVHEWAKSALICHQYKKDEVDPFEVHQKHLIQEIEEGEAKLNKLRAELPK
ncbi:hypothetical protein TRFO_34078 [Tritrichomonas foetus]|uniref:Uncharacterized protein n=1 Tax=Tritrichomonas foetus TaxID=1144522 RepID=A0A1J4JM44_9EUKA|nr:hypothetical protein TRFO_34078 [Tritrichomonas foetus]|eukprot:OHS99495.1 hypothetical protein TRFO_34078 [Tritrichomonas foetus]